MVSIQKNFRLSGEDLEIIDQVGNLLGIDDTAVVKLALRRLAQLEGLAVLDDFLRAYTEDGGTATISIYGEKAMGVGLGLSIQAREVFLDAKYAAQPRHDGTLDKATEVLEKSGLFSKITRGLK